MLRPGPVRRTSDPSQYRPPLPPGDACGGSVVLPGESRSSLPPCRDCVGFRPPSARPGPTPTVVTHRSAALQATIAYDRTAPPRLLVGAGDTLALHLRRNVGTWEGFPNVAQRSSQQTRCEPGVPEPAGHKASPAVSGARSRSVPTHVSIRWEWSNNGALVRCGIGPVSAGVKRLPRFGGKDGCGSGPESPSKGADPRTGQRGPGSG